VKIVTEAVECEDDSKKSHKKTDTYSDPSEQLFTGRKV